MKHHCLHCLHQWIGRLDRRPVVCPRCKRYNWDKQPKGKEPTK